MKPTCSKRVRIPGLHLPRYRDCGCTAKVEREGEWFCGRHDPVAVKTRYGANAPKREATEARRRTLFLTRFLRK